MTLNIFLLGQFKLEAENILIELPSRPAQSILAYLALNAGVAQRREKLSSLIWPEATESNARSYLRQALWRLRKSIEIGSLNPDNFLDINVISVTFSDQSDYWMDADALRKSAKTETIKELTETVNLYRGELLPGFYEDWVVLERDQLQAAYHQKMKLLLDCLIQNQQWDLALKYGEQWIKFGDAHEPAYRSLMRSHAGLGDHAMVIDTFQRCFNSLDRELGVMPSSETKHLYEQILAGELETSVSFPQIQTAYIIQHPAFLEQDLPQPMGKSLFVARQKELAELEKHLNLAISGLGRVVFVTGQAGSGKTSLMDEFSKRAQESYNDLLVAGGNCNAHTGIGDPYLPFREILELLTGNVESRWSAGAISSNHARRLWNALPFIAQVISESNSDLIDTFVSGSALLKRAQNCVPLKTDWLIRLNELAEPHQYVAAPPSSQQSDLFEQYSRVLAGASCSNSLLLILDDLQWADLGSISLLFHLGRHLAGSRILILGAYRPEELALGRNGERHPLEPVINEFRLQFGDMMVDLDMPDQGDFVNALLESEPYRLGDAFSYMLHKQTRGLPLFTIELLRGMQDRGDLVRDQQGHWIESDSLNWENIPARIEAVIAERVGRLSRSMRSILQVASVEGEEFTAEIIAKVQEVHQREVLECLNRDLERKHRLIRTQSIQRVNGQILSQYRFQHTLIHRYIYSSLNPVERVYLHEQVGIALEELFILKNQIIAEATVVPKLARHFQEARINDKAVHYLDLAGKRALHLSAYEEAITHLAKGLELLMSEPDNRERAEIELSLQFSLSIALKGSRSNASPETETVLIRTRELCYILDRKAQLCSVLGELGLVYYVRAEYESALEIAEESLHMARQLNDPILIALGHWQTGFINFGMGNYHPARNHLNEVLRIYSPEKHHKEFIFWRGSDAGASALAYLACCLWLFGYPDQAFEIGQQALTLAQKLGHPFTRADVLFFAGCLLNSMCRDADRLMYNAEELVHLSDKLISGWSGSGTIYKGEALFLAGQFEEAINHIEQGEATRRLRNVRCYSSSVQAALAISQVKSGEIDSGLKTLKKVIALVDETGERYWEAELFRIQAKIMLMQGDEYIAESSLKKSIEVARSQYAKSLELRAATDLARLWKEQGKPDKAKNLLQEIYSWFTEGFDTPDLMAAKALLEEMQPGSSNIAHKKK